ncbi:MAG: hypothetical protein KDC34_16325 [Saprospiraceae bacterium]|nr:hypothetical protein [Saprospiraceae bacterium]
MAKKKNTSIVFWQTVLMSGLLLGGVLLVSIYGGNRLAEAQPKIGSGIRTALMLFVLWLIVSSGIRSLNSLNKKSGFANLVLGGMLISGIGSLACFSFAKVVSFFREGSTLSSIFDFKSVLFFSGVGLILSLLTVINLQTKNRALGNVLEVLVIAALIFVLVYFA